MCSLQKASALLNNKVNKINREFQDLKKEFSEIKQTHIAHGKEVTEVKDKVAANHVEMKDKVQAMKNEIFAEMRDRNRRKLNIIVHGVPEAGEEVVMGRERMEFDKLWLEEVLTAINVPIYDLKKEIKFIKRLGEKIVIKPNLDLYK